MHFSFYFVTGGFFTLWLTWLNLTFCLLFLFKTFFQEAYDTYDPKQQSFSRLPCLCKRSKVTEIVAAHDIVFALTQSGVCAAFSRGWHNCSLFSLWSIYHLI